MRFAGTQLSNFIGDTTDFSQIAGMSQKGRSLERRAVMEGEGMVSNAGVQSMGKVKSAGYQADAIEAEGAAAGQSAIASGIGDMFSGLAGGIGSKLGGSSGDATVGVSRTSSGMGIPGSVAPKYKGVARPYYGPAY